MRLRKVRLWRWSLWGCKELAGTFILRKEESTCWGESLSGDGVIQTVIGLKSVLFSSTPKDCEVIKGSEFLDTLTNDKFLSNFSLTCNASGFPTPRISWQTQEEKGCNLDYNTKIGANKARKQFHIWKYFILSRVTNILSLTHHLVWY